MDCTYCWNAEASCETTKVRPSVVTTANVENVIGRFNELTVDDQALPTFGSSRSAIFQLREPKQQLPLYDSALLSQETARSKRGRSKNDKIDDDRTPTSKKRRSTAHPSEPQRGEEHVTTSKSERYPVRGLENPNGICFANAVLQCLQMIPEFVAAVREQAPLLLERTRSSEVSEEALRGRSEAAFATALVEHFEAAGLQTSRSFLSPLAFSKFALAHVASDSKLPFAKESRQMVFDSVSGFQDCQEFLIKMLDKCDKMYFYGGYSSVLI